MTSSVALLKHFRDTALDKIPDEVERFKTSRLNQEQDRPGQRRRKVTDKKIKPATVNRELACLRALFNHAIKADLPLRNPISKTAAKALREDNEQTAFSPMRRKKSIWRRRRPIVGRGNANVRNRGKTRRGLQDSTS